MRVTLPTPMLAATLRTASRAVPTRPSMPILGAILLQASTGLLRATGTDLEMTIEAACPAQVHAPGTAALPARLLTDIATSLDSDTVEIESDGASARITAGAARFEILGMAAQDYPSLPGSDGSLHIPLPSRGLAELIRCTAFAASTDESRPALAGARLEIRDSTALLVATDGSRLALHTLPLPEKPAYSLSGTVPRRALAEIARLLGGDGHAQLSWTDTTLSVDIPGTPSVTLTARVIGLPFPSWHQVLDQARPANPTATATAPRAPLLAAIRRVSIAARESRFIRVATAPGALLLSSTSPTVGSAHEQVGAETEGEALQAAFNAAYLLEALDAFPLERVRLTLTGPLTPAAIGPERGETPVCVIAPVHTST
jgi:DNA polymerase-3 subunit beta